MMLQRNQSLTSLLTYISKHYSENLYKQVIRILYDIETWMCYKHDTFKNDKIRNTIILKTEVEKNGRYFILPVPNSVSGTCLCNKL